MLRYVYNNCVNEYILLYTCYTVCNVQKPALWVWHILVSTQCLMVYYYSQGNATTYIHSDYFILHSLFYDKRCCRDHCESSIGCYECGSMTPSYEYHLYHLWFCGVCTSRNVSTLIHQILSWGGWVLQIRCLHCHLSSYCNCFGCNEYFAVTNFQSCDSKLSVNVFHYTIFWY